MIKIGYISSKILHLVSEKIDKNGGEVKINPLECDELNIRYNISFNVAIVVKQQNCRHPDELLDSRFRIKCCIS